MAISIDFLSNVGKFLSGTKDAESALEDVGGALDDLARTAQRQGESTGEHVSSGVKGGASDAETALHTLSGKLDAIGDSTGPATAGKAVDDLGGKLDGIGDTEGPATAGKAVDDLGGKIDGLAQSDSGSKAGDAVRDGVKDGTEKAEGSVDSLSAKFSALAVSAKTEGDKAGGEIKSGVHKGTEEANEGVETLKENTGSNLKEVAASFDGTWEGVAGGAQGLVAEIAEGFGPAGLIAGAVAAGGIGLIVSGIEGAQEKTDALKADISDLTGQYIEAGNQGKRSMSDIASAIEDLAKDQDGTNLTELWDDAKKGGLDYKDAVAALVSGNAGEIAKERDHLQEVADKHYAIQKAGKATADETPGDAAKSLESIGKVDKALGDAEETAKAAGKAQEAAAAAGLTEFGLKQKAVEQLHDAYSDAAGEVDSYIDKESGLFDVSKYITAMTKRQKALEDYQETLATSSLSPQAKSYIEGLGADQAALLVAGYAKASDKQKEKLNQIWTTTGNENAGSYGDALGSSLKDKTVKGPKVTPPSTADYVREVQEANAKAQQYLIDHPLKAAAVAYTAFGKPLY